MSRRLTKEELDLQFEQFLKESVSDESVESGSRRPSVLDSLGKLPPSRAERQKTPPSRPWWQDDDDEFGLLGTGKSFRKSLRKSQPIQEEDEEKLQRHGEDGEQGEGERSGIGFFSRDSLEHDDSVMASGPVDMLSRSGMDTLEEEEEEERRRFFARLEGGANSTIDYSRLNRELESTGSTLNTLLRRTEVPETLKEEKSKPCEKSSPDDSADYSEDFDEEEASDREKESHEQKPNKPGMLAKVSLHDSLNSTDGALVPAEAPAGSSGDEEEEERKVEDIAHNIEAPAGQSYGQSGASEVEALQEAYRQLSHSAEVSEVKEQRSSSLAAGGGIASQTLSPAVPFTSTLKPVSTTESELPTAEELMRPIGPDSSFARGFSLHPVSEVEQQQQQEEEEKDKEEEEVRESRGRSPSKGRPQKDQDDEEEEKRPVSVTSHHRSIAEEVRRLMEEQQEVEEEEEEEKKPREVKTPQQQPPGNRAKARKRQPAWRPTIFAHTSASALKSIPLAKPSPAPAVAKTFGTAHAEQTTKPPSPQVQRKQQNQEQRPSRIPTLGYTQTTKDSEASLRLSSELVASVQSFAAFLQQQVEASSSSTPLKSLSSDPSHTPALPKLPEVAMDADGGGGGAEGSEISPAAPPAAAERSSLERVRLQLAQKDREMHLREQDLQEEHSRQISSLKQENYLLHSKLRQAEEESRRGGQSPGRAGDQASEEKVSNLEKEVREQETLLQGYHQENEKLYLQVKALQAQNKRNEEAMFTENQRLHYELAIARDKVSRNSMQRTVGFVGTNEEDYNVAELLGQVKALERSEARLQEEARRLRQEKQALQVDLDIMKKERDLAKVQRLHTSGDLGFELKVLEQKHQEEVAVLKKRLQWYAENQELLDRDAGRLRAATAEVKVLNEQVERLKSQVDSKACQQQKRIRERAADAKRIQDLERQVKEMEEILRRRHPNSLPALMYAAAAAEAAATTEGTPEKPEKPERSPTPTTPKSSILLQRRVQRLEAELESRDEDAKRSLRVIEQQFQRVKLQYEQRIGELQQQLSERHQTLRKTEGGEEEEEGEQNEDEEVCVRSLQEEVRKLKEVQQERESALKAEVVSLKEQLSKAQQLRSPGASTQRHQRQAEEAQSARVERLTAEIATKSRSLQELSRTVERLQRERHTMLSGRWVGGKGQEVKGKSGAAGLAAATTTTSAPSTTTTKGTMTTESFPATQDEKAYQPAAFAGSHISEVQAENDRLQERLEGLKQESQQEREALQQTATRAQAELQRLKEHSTQQLAALSADHQRELESLRARHALDHSSSKVAELTNQVSSQEIMVRHLRDQLKDLQGTKEALTVSRLREDTLQHQLTRLLEELKQAKEAHSPELRHFASLERKIHSMELRYSEREKELQQVIAETRVATQAEQQGELERWKRLAQSRSRELDTFRLELDAILDVLKELQRQGVVIPAPEHTRIPWGR